MYHRNVHRGFAVLTVAAALALSGARPAAAQGLGVFEQGASWLASLLQAPSTRTAAQSGASAWDRVLAQIDKGLGVDPNGGNGIAPPAPPSGHGDS
jgi:hypothetical protein